MKIAVVVLASSCFGLIAITQGAEPVGKLLYSRADVVGAATGEVTFRRAYTRQLELPSEICQGKPFSCNVDRVYGQVYLLAFAEETISRGADGKPTMEHRDLGRLAIAVDFAKEVEDRFENAVSAHVSQLGVAAFRRPQAGMGFLDPPLDQPTLLQSNTPIWVCKELDGAYSGDLLIPQEHVAVRSYSLPGDAACRTIEGSATTADASTYRTMPDIQTQIRRDLRLDSFTTLKGLNWANRLVALPEGATFKKTALSGDQKSGGAWDSQRGSFRGHEGRYGAVERDVRLPSASLDLSEVPMWITRWTFESTREQYGGAPKSHREPTTSVLVAVVPVSDPLMDTLDRSRADLFVPEDRLIAAVVARVARTSDFGPAVVDDALADPEVWPPRGDWLVVTCRDDGSARYGISPFAGAAQVTNPREACAAIRRAIGQ